MPRCTPSGSCRAIRDGRPSPHRSPGADRPDRVESVDDRASVAPLHAEAVGVLRDIRDGVGCLRRGTARRRTAPRRGEGGGEQADAGEHGADHGDARRAEPADQHRGQEPRGDGTRRERGDREAVAEVVESESGLDLRVARQDVREQRPVWSGTGRRRRCGRAGTPGPEPFVESIRLKPCLRS